MNWALEIDPRVRRMRAWGGAFPGLLAAIFARLEGELAADPDAHLGEMIPPLSHRSYVLIFNGVAGVPDGLRCQFAVEVDRPGHRLVLVGGRMNTPGRET